MSNVELLYQFVLKTWIIWVLVLSTLFYAWIDERAAKRAYDARQAELDALERRMSYETQSLRGVDVHYYDD